MVSVTESPRDLRIGIVKSFRVLLCPDQYWFHPFSRGIALRTADFLEAGLGKYNVMPGTTENLSLARIFQDPLTKR